WAPALAVTQPPKPINRVNAARVGLAGTAQPGVLITVYFRDQDSAIVGPRYAQAGARGGWSLKNIDVTSLADGPIECQVYATDPAGNEAAVSGWTTKSMELRVGLVQGPINVRKGSAMRPVIAQLWDAYGNAVPLAGQAVTLSVLDASGSVV